VNEAWIVEGTGDTFLLPGGYYDARQALQRECVLRPLTGREEELLAGQFRIVPGAVLVTRLLTRCIGRLGSLDVITPEIVRQMLIADRDYVLLKLRQAMFGNHVQAILGCPACELKMDIDFDLDQVTVESRRPTSRSMTFELSPEAGYTGTTHHTVTFRLPIGDDQEYLSSHPDLDEAEAVTVLLERCLLRLGDIAPVDQTVIANLSGLARQEIGAQMESVSPSLEWEMELICPECGCSFVHLFDFAAFFLAEVNLRREQLYREVHFLALHYHWPASEIFALTRAHRRTFLDLLATELRHPATEHSR
jgi:hypothetical protein